MALALNIKYEQIYSKVAIPVWWPIYVPATIIGHNEEQPCRTLPLCTASAHHWTSLKGFDSLHEQIIKHWPGFISRALEDGKQWFLGKPCPIVWHQVWPWSIQSWSDWRTMNWFKERTGIYHTMSLPICEWYHVSDTHNVTIPIWLSLIPLMHYLAVFFGNWVDYKRCWMKYSWQHNVVYDHT